MDKKQYNNIIFGTVKREKALKDEPMKMVRKICNNMGVALPQGDCKEILKTLKAGGYMAWRRCSAREAQAAANSGIAAIAISNDSIAILSADTTEASTATDETATTAAVMTLSTAATTAGVEYYSYGTGVVTTEDTNGLYCSNSYLSKSEMRVNAQYILSFLRARGWTKQSVCGMLGNMEIESTINPGLWQGLKEGDFKVGFGLVQWTPATKYIDWATQEGLSYDDIDGQLKRILYEVYANPGVQWIKTSNYNITFSEFTQSTRSPDYLARAFVYNYERPLAKYRREELRAENAEYWYNTLT